MRAVNASAFRQMREIIDYLNATRNEIAIDEAMLRISGDEAAKTGHIPRVGKWIGYSKRSPRLVWTIAHIAWLVWLFGGGTFFLFVDFLPRWLNALRTQTKEAPSTTSGYILALSSRVGDIITKQTFPDLTHVWITMPWAPLRRTPAGAQVVDVFSLLSPRQIVMAFRNAVLAHRLLCRRPFTRKWALQSYTAFKWFAVRAAIDKLPGDLVMTEHFDRWAVLIDRSARRNRRKLTLVQHGSVAGVDGKGEEEYIFSDLPTKLKSVSRLYVYNQDEEKIFRKHFLEDSRGTNGLEVSYFKPRIELFPTERGNYFRILFVGHPMCEAIQSALFQKLRGSIAVNAFYKPHPLAPSSPMLGTVGWNVITDPGHFPEVDLLISYPSTLVIEYAAWDVPAVTHPLNADVQDCDRILQEVLAYAQTGIIQPTLGQRTSETL